MRSEAKTLQLQDCLDALIDYRGKTPVKTDSGVPLVTAKIIKAGRIETPTEYIATENYDAWMRRGIPRAGDVVLTVEAPLGEVAQLGPEKIALAQRVVTLRGKRGLLDSTYLLYWLQTEGAQAELKSRATGTTVLGIKQSELRKVPIDLPDLATQVAAAHVLKALDDRISLLRETNATLEAIAQALFKSWFVDFDPVRAKQQGLAPAGMDEATAALFPTCFEESAVGLVPRAWSICRIEQIADRIGMGPFGSNIKVETFVDHGVPVLNGSNVQGALVEDGAFRFVTEEHAARLRNSCVQAGDIVLTHRGTLGQVALVPDQSRYPEYVCSQSQFFLRCDSRAMEPEWLLYFLRSPAGQHLLLSNASQVGVPSIARPTTHLRSMRLAVPPLDLVRRYSEIVRSLHASVVSNRERAMDLAALRDTLLPRLISGQLRLMEAEAALEAV